MTSRQEVTSLPDGFLADYDTAWNEDTRWKVVGRFFRVKPVDSNHDIRPGMFYFVLADEGHVLRAGGDRPNVDPVPMTDVIADRPMNPVPRKTMFELGRGSKLFRLTPRDNPLPGAPAAATNAPSNTSNKTAVAPEPGRPRVESSIEMGSFTQLQTVAQASGIVPAADQIGRVRDCEFRMGQYQTGFEAIERIYVNFKQAAEARVERLRREEIDYKSGVLKMSAKQWQQKKHRDTVQTNIIERTRRHFVRVLDGLRALMLAK
ncbi:MAG: hypothetical protein JW719_03895 [Pirellulales bacterium]|nr:hypothetical protein [Pirellulales bacterium]